MHKPGRSPQVFFNLQLSQVFCFTFVTVLIIFINLFILETVVNKSGRRNYFFTAAYVALHLTVSVSNGRYIVFFSGFGDAELAIKLILGSGSGFAYRLSF